MALQELPGSLRAVVWLLGGEAVLAGGFAIYAGYQGLTDSRVDPADAIALAGFGLVIALALGGLALALAGRKPRARAPAIVLQLLLVMIALVLVTGGLAWVGVPLALLGVAVGTLLLAPGTGDALTSSRG